MKRTLSKFTDAMVNASIIIAVAVVSAIVLPFCFVGEMIEKRKGHS
jgi:hypothetical protein